MVRSNNAHLKIFKNKILKLFDHIYDHMYETLDGIFLFDLI
jgi:hypothetical protein